MDTESDFSEEFNEKYFPESKTSLKEDYNIEKLLGDGAFSEVYKAQRKKDGEQVAIKIIKKSKVAQYDLQREVEIWRLASKSCSRVVLLYEIYEDDEHVYLVMELMVGGELFEKIANMTEYSEVYVSKLMKQIFLIIRDLHKVDIIHQDLKPENLLLMEDSMILKLCDFGLAEIADDNTELFGCVGSTTYMAPEVTNESGHHKPVDMYAAGVIMYIMLCGYPPFEPENGIVELEFPEREWDDISNDAKELITNLLDEDPLKRPTPEEVLRHRWLLSVDTIRNPKGLMRTINTLKHFMEMGPNGTMKEHRGESKNPRKPVMGLFESSESIPAQSQPQVPPTPSPVLPSATSVPVATPATLPTNPVPPKAEKKGKHEMKAGVNSVPLLLPSVKLPVTKGDDKKKPGAQTSRVDPEQEKVTDPKKDKLGDKDKKKKKDKKKRQSLPLTTNELKDNGFEFDNKGRIVKKGDQLKVEVELDKDKKKKSTKKYEKPEKKIKEESIIDKLNPESFYSLGNPALDEMIMSFYRDLLYQRDAIQHLRMENSFLRTKLNEELDAYQQLHAKLDGEILSLKKTIDSERKEIKNLQAQTLASEAPLPLKSVKSDHTHHHHHNSNNFHVIPASSSVGNVPPMPTKPVKTDTKASQGKKKKPNK
uniref:non-specific serine/threonine protein kinase n=1 Tax=Arcella intermedia TaxID=1963864 RepID=A0A6B2KZE3_9EUKA|eukprot:TRINITY_DN5361_c1_g1_i1.p1 TRINITY_DN5361_c1_g1~~TRINITY_DN5361_c1_g1_i1.p1  ORF type:complete len:650 (+),score=227.54 TRINITY_DN5361_c1_g1_i1:79-2028(+)